MTVESKGDAVASIGAALARIGRRAGRVVLGAEAVAAAKRAFDASGPVVIVAAPCVAVIGYVMRAAPAARALIPVAVAFAWPVAALSAAWLRRRLAPLPRARGLSLVESELGLKGRLTAAYEFARLPAPSGFQRAAIEDAEPYLRLASDHRLLERPTEALRSRALLAPLLAALLGLGVAFGLEFLPRGTAPAPESAPDVIAAAPRSAPDSPDAAPPPPRDDAPRAESTPPRATDAPSQLAQRTASPPMKLGARESQGKSGGGRSAAATPSGSQSESQGFEGASSPPADKSEESKVPEKPKKPKKKRAEPESSKKKLSDASGSTAGRGTGTGSSKNPGAVDWASKDQVASDDEDPLENEPDVEDESSEEEARGGLQPNLRDRRPAVNRDLTIGFGVPETPNPDANGRGSGGDMKKSRGVASLVLGVPIPDHVKGQPNPGRTKITQERVEPKPDAAMPEPARPGVSRATPVGPVATDLAGESPWQRLVVRRFFERRQEGTKP